MDGLRTFPAANFGAEQKRVTAIGRRKEGDTEMISKLMNKEEANAALVLALSRTIMVLVANDPGPVSLRRIVSRVMSNPIPVRGAAGTSGDASVPHPYRRAAA